MAELVFHRRGEELLRVLLDRPVTTIGRGAGADVSLPHPEVSRRHLSVEKRDEGWVATDLSGRGTAIGGVPRDEAPLREGTEILLGDWIATFRSEAANGLSQETRTSIPLTREVESPFAHIRGNIQLRIRSGDGERFRLLSEEATIGQGPDCTIPLDDAYASALHCRLLPRGDRVRVLDLGSTNGTWIGGVRIDQAEVPLGTVVRIGESEILLDASEKQASAFEGIVSEARAMREVFNILDRVAPSLVPVCVLGETGTGKELVAKALHTRSERSKGPFIPVNCSAISPNLVESELFGHEKGAFTGAIQARKGAFEEASRGTIFLDEVGELPLEIQAKLLRTLELGEIRRVGSSRPFRVDTRIVAATHRDLRAMVKQGTFREDLYYRLAVVRVELPPLRNRGSDLRLLAAHLLKAYAPRGAIPALSDDAWVRLEAHTWPGNVRELRNVLARALLLRKGSRITADDLIFDGPAVPVSPIVADGDETVFLLGKTLAEVERETTLKALRRHKGNRRAAARELGMARSTLQIRARELGVPPPSEFEEE